MIKKKKLQQIRNLAERKEPEKEGIKKCPNCGIDLDIKLVFCHNCGHIFIE